LFAHAFFNFYSVRLNRKKKKFHHLAMNANNDIDAKTILDQNETVSYSRFDGHLSISSCSSIILSNCSSDEKNDNNRYTPPLKWKRQKILNNDCHNP